MRLKQNKRTMNERHIGIKFEQINSNRRERFSIRNLEPMISRRRALIQAAYFPNIARGEALKSSWRKRARCGRNNEHKPGKKQFYIRSARTSPKGEKWIGSSSFYGGKMQTNKRNLKGCFPTRIRFFRAMFTYALWRFSIKRKLLHMKGKSPRVLWSSESRGGKSFNHLAFAPPFRGLFFSVC